MLNPSFFLSQLIIKITYLVQLYASPNFKAGLNWTSLVNPHLGIPEANTKSLKIQIDPKFKKLLKQIRELGVTL